MVWGRKPMSSIIKNVDVKEAAITNKPLISQHNVAVSSYRNGWTYAVMKNGKITLLSVSDSGYDVHRKQEMNEDRQWGENDNQIITNMIDRWQKERDSLNDLLGDRSPYWDLPELGEYSDDDE